MVSMALWIDLCGGATTAIVWPEKKNVKCMELWCIICEWLVLGAILGTMIDFNKTFCVVRGANVRIFHFWLSWLIDCSLNSNFLLLASQFYFFLSPGSGSYHWRKSDYYVWGRGKRSYHWAAADSRPWRKSVYYLLQTWIILWYEITWWCEEFKIA